jgi:hypothetical protein
MKLSSIPVDVLLGFVTIVMAVLGGVVSVIALQGKWLNTIAFRIIFDFRSLGDLPGNRTVTRECGDGKRFE